MGSVVIPLEYLPLCTSYDYNFYYHEALQILEIAIKQAL